MRILGSSSLRATAVVTVVALCLAPLAIGQSAKPANDIPRLANGKPDFTGLWARPRVGNITQDGKECGSGYSGCTQKGSGPPPFTPLGAQLMKAPKFDYTVFCLPWGYTRAMQTEYPIEIIQNPKRLAILYESNNIFHVVPTDGRRHPAEMDPGWMGKSIGSYEGDTLVIDTRGFNGKINLDIAGEHPTSDALRIVERLSFIDANRIAYDITIEDPKIYAKPLQNHRTWVRMKEGEELQEYWCMENNRDLLEGHVDHLKKEEAFKKYFGID